MADCLVTKLKGSVSNDLIKLGEIRIEALSGTFPSSPSTAEFNIVGSPYTISSDQKRITITDKYNVTQLRSQLANWEFNSSDWKYTKIDLMNLWIVHYNVKEEDLPSTITFLYMNGCPINIEKLGHLTSLNIIQAINNWRKLTGSIEGFVAAQRANGRTTNSGGVNIGQAGNTIAGSITYQGNVLAAPVKVSWDATTITVTNL